MLLVCCWPTLTANLLNETRLGSLVREQSALQSQPLFSVLFSVNTQSRPFTHCYQTAAMKRVIFLLPGMAKDYMIILNTDTWRSYKLLAGDLSDLVISRMCSKAACCPSEWHSDIRDIRRTLRQGATNFSHMRVGSASTGVLLPRVSLINTRLWRTPPHFWWIPIPPGRSPTPHPFAKSH